MRRATRPAWGGRAPTLLPQGDTAIADFDKAARYQVKQDPPGVFGWLLGPAAAALTFEGWLDTRRLALPSEGDLVCDMVAGFRHSAHPDQVFALILELQTESRDTTVERLLDYAVRLRKEPPAGVNPTLPLPVSGAVVNLTGPAQVESLDMNLPGVPACALSFQVLQRTLRDEDAPATLAAIQAGRTTRWLLPWIPLMQGGNEPAIMDQWKMAASGEPDEGKRSILAALTLCFADLKKTTAAWQKSLEGWNVQKSAFLEEARDQGRLETRRDDLLVMLEDRFGALPEEIVQRIQATTDLAKLKAALRGVPSLESLDKLQL